MYYILTWTCRQPGPEQYSWENQIKQRFNLLMYSFLKLVIFYFAMPIDPGTISKYIGFHTMSCRSSFSKHDLDMTLTIYKNEQDQDRPQRTIENFNLWAPRFRVFSVHVCSKAKTHYSLKPSFFTNLNIYWSIRRSSSSK